VEAIDGLIGDGRFFASDEVWEEIKKRDVTVKDWAQPRKESLFLETNIAVTTEVTAILERFPRMVMSGGRRNRAAPFVVAVARREGATVVTGEGHDGSATRPKIPFVCAQLGVPCITFTQFIADQRWTFTLSDS
jgi:hypothetical protein